MGANWLGLAMALAIVGCQKEQSTSVSAQKLSPATAVTTTVATPSSAPPTADEPSVAIDVEDDEVDDNGLGEPMDEVDDVSDKAGAADPSSAEDGTDPTENEAEE